MSYSHNTKLLLSLGGLFGSDLLKDWSPFDRGATVMRGSPFIDTAKPNGYMASGHFGPGDAPEVLLPGLDLTGAFTFEAWLYLPATSASGPYNAMCSFMTYGSNDDRLQWYVSENTVRLWSDTTSHLVDFDFTSYAGKEDKWTHIVTQRLPDTSIEIFLDGALIHTEASSTAPTYAEKAILNYARASGAHQHSDEMWLQDLRVTTGEAIYDAAGFTPPPRLVGKLAGSVLDSAGNAAQRRVISYVRGSAEKFAEVSSDASGDFVLPAYASESYAVALSSDPAENALIFDHLEPVQP